MKFLIAGLGSIGRRHLRNLRALGEQDILLYRTRRSTLPDDELAGLPVETDLTRALDHKPDAVIVANPTALHLEVAIPALEAGCHLLLEKPVAASLDGIEALERAARASTGKVLVGFQFRFHPSIRQAAEWLKAGRIGRPLSFRFHWGEYLPGWHPWEDHRQGYAARADLGGGVILTLCHPLDYLRPLLGEVEALWCFAGSHGLELPVEDTAEIGLRLRSGALGSVHLDYNQRPPAHRWEIVGAEGTLRWDNTDGILHLLSADGPAETFAPPQGFERNDMFLEQMRHFLAVVRGETEPEGTLQDGIHVLRLALGALESAKQDRMIRW